MSEIGPEMRGATGGGGGAEASNVKGCETVMKTNGENQHHRTEKGDLKWWLGD